MSKKTVSRVINDSPRVNKDTRETIKNIIKETGFKPNPQAQALAFRTSFLIAMVYDNPSPQYVVNMQRGILAALEGTRYQLVLRPIDRNSPDYREQLVDFVEKHNPFGLILVPSISEDDALAQSLRDLKCAYVRIASVDIDEPNSRIQTSDAEGAKLAARHLAQLGHKRIAHIHGPNLFRSSHERLTGFREGLAEFGIELPDSMIAEGAYTFDSGEKCAITLLHGKERPSAIFAGNDEMAMGVYSAARKAGLRIPEDISVVGYDDTPVVARVWPPMTSVRSPIRDVGFSAAKLLMDQKDLAGGAASGHKDIFELELIVRESTAPLEPRRTGS